MNSSLFLMKLGILNRHQEESKLTQNSLHKSLILKRHREFLTQNYLENMKIIPELPKDLKLQFRESPDYLEFLEVLLGKQ